VPCHDHQHDRGPRVHAFGFKGPNIAIVTACTTGLHCIGEAGRMIEYGDADVMIAGGSEATVSPLGIGGFAAMRALSTRNDDPATASRPWDKDRDGFVLGEGAGVVVLEEYEHAVARGAKIYAELAGFGMSADAGHMTAPNMDGPRRAMLSALRNAGVNVDQVDYLNAHGTSTPLGDLNETNAIKAALGDHAKKDCREFNQVHDRSLAWVVRAELSRSLPFWLCTTRKAHRPSIFSTRTPSAISTTAPMLRATCASTWPSKTTLGLVARTVPWSSSASRDVVARNRT
jgi:hypothetical protein